ncbi:MAG TPA: DUF6541 family protein, partial [Chloroflexota bacterium]|nr:DUF6541 family protein [Chloroflexota bacterium]
MSTTFRPRAALGWPVRLLAATGGRPAGLASLASLPAWLPGLVLAIVLTLPAWVPFLRPDLSLWHLFDGASHLRKAYQLGQLIKEGNWYPRWVPDLYGGYGYPTFNFYAPAVYYLTLALAVLLPGVGLYEAYQLLGGVSAVLIIGGLYALAWRLWHHAPAAVLTAGAVAYAPYLFPNNLFMSGWVPQVLGNGLTVWLLVACLGLWQAAGAGRPLARWWWAIVGLTAGLLLTHNPSAAIAAPLTGAWLVCLSLRRVSGRALLGAASAALLGAALAAVLWVPALLETSLVQVERMNRGELHYRNQFLIWPGFHPPLWGLQERSAYTIGFPIDLHLIYPHSAYGPTKLGLWQGVMFVGASVALLVTAARLARARSSEFEVPGSELTRNSGPGTRNWNGDQRLATLTLVFGLLLFLFAYSQSFDWWLPLWERFSLLRAIQLPARFLPAACYGVAMATGASLALYAPVRRITWALVVLAVLVLAATWMPRRPLPLEPGAPHSMGVTNLIELERTEPGFSNSTEEFLPRTAYYEVHHEGEARGFWLYERLWPEAGWLGGRVRAWAGAAAVRGLWGGALWTVAEVEAGPEGATLAFHQLAFPGWRAWVDGAPAAVRPAPWNGAQAIAPGFALVEVPAGRHRVGLRFGPDGPRLAGAAASLAA